MQNGALQLCRAIGIDAAVVGLSGCAHDVAAADRTMFRHLKAFVAPRMILVLDNFDNLGDHIPAAFDLNPVADFYAQALDLVHVVKRGARDSSAANGHRLEPSDGCEFSCSPDLRDDVFDLGDRASRGVLVGDRPARSFASKSEFALERGAVDLNDNAVYFVRQRVAFPFPALDKLPDLAKILCKLVMRIHLESGRFKCGQGFGMTIEISTPIL